MSSLGGPKLKKKKKKKNSSILIIMPRAGLELLGGDLCCLPQPLSYPLDKEYETEVFTEKEVLLA